MICRWGPEDGGLMRMRIRREGSGAGVGIIPPGDGKLISVGRIRIALLCFYFDRESHLSL